MVKPRRPAAPTPNPRDKIGGNNPPIDMQADGAADRKVPKDRLEAIKKKGIELKATYKALADAQKVVEQHAAVITLIECKELPALMGGKLSSLTLDSGEVIELKEYVTARLPKEDQEKRAKALKWLRDNGHGDLIKRVVIAEFGKGDDKTAEVLVEVLKKRGYEFIDEADVHWKTLEGFVKEQIEAGANIPLDLFGAFPVKKAKLVQPKAKR